MGRAAKLKEQRKELRKAVEKMPFLNELVTPKMYTKEQVDKMVANAFRQGYEHRSREVKTIVREEVAKSTDALFEDCDYHVLFVLHQKYKYGIKRLHDFYNDFYDAHLELRKYYELEDAGEFMPRKIIKSLGIDLNEWRKEAEDKYSV